MPGGRDSGSACGAVTGPTFSMRKLEVGNDEVLGAILLHYDGEDGPTGYEIPDELMVRVPMEIATGVRVREVAVRPEETSRERLRRENVDDTSGSD